MIRFFLAGLLGCIVLVAGDGSARAATVEVERIDLNTASKSQLERLPGIGEELARRIIERRVRRPFRRVVELLRIQGIGRRTYFRLRDRVHTGPVARTLSAGSAPNLAP